MVPKPIVVGVDDKQPSALRFALEEATVHDRPIRVVHCVEPLITGDVIVPAATADDTWRAAGQEILDAAKAFIDADPPAHPTTYELAAGAPTGVLLDEADYAALIVVGTDSAGWADRLFGGHVAEHLAKRSPAPVAIVPERSWPTPLTGGVYVALDTGELATKVLKFAFKEASHRGNELHVIHALPTGTDIDEVTEERARIAIQLSGWSEKYPDVNVTRRIVFDESDEGCLRATEEAELLILGRSVGPRIPVPWSHPVLTKIARRAHCPCVVVPSTRHDDAETPHEFGGGTHQTGD
jgi:nucleotide-binding universal stress UspA family protein